MIVKKYICVASTRKS